MLLIPQTVQKSVSNFAHGLADTQDLLTNLRIEVQKISTSSGRSPCMTSDPFNGSMMCHLDKQQANYYLFGYSPTKRAIYIERQRPELMGDKDRQAPVQPALDSSQMSQYAAERCPQHLISELSGQDVSLPVLSWATWTTPTPVLSFPSLASSEKALLTTHLSANHHIKRLESSVLDQGPVRLEPTSDLSRPVHLPPPGASRQPTVSDSPVHVLRFVQREEAHGKSLAKGDRIFGGRRAGYRAQSLDHIVRASHHMQRHEEVQECSPRCQRGSSSGISPAGIFFLNAFSILCIYRSLFVGRLCLCSSPGKVHVQPLLQHRADAESAAAVQMGGS